MRFRPIIGWAIFFFLIAIVAQAVPSPRAIFYFLQGKQRFNTGNFEAAARAYEESVNADPTFLRGYVELGSSYYALERYPQAEEAFKDALAIKEDSCASCGLGMIYRLEGRKDEAEELLNQSIRRYPRDTCLYDQLGRLYYDAKEYQRAIDVFNQRVKVSPDAVSYHFIANATKYTGKPNESIDVYLQAQRLAPKNVRILVDLGRAYGDLNRYADASKAFEQAISLAPDDLQAHALLSVTRFMLKDREGAMEQYRWVLAKDPGIAAELLEGLNELAEERRAIENRKLGKPATALN